MTTARTSQDRILDARARAWNAFATWLGVMLTLSIIPLAACLIALARWAWGLGQ